MKIVYSSKKRYMLYYIQGLVVKINKLGGDDVEVVMGEYSREYLFLTNNLYTRLVTH